MKNVGSTEKDSEECSAGAVGWLETLHHDKEVVRASLWASVVKSLKVIFASSVPTSEQNTRWFKSCKSSRFL